MTHHFLPEECVPSLDDPTSCRYCGHALSASAPPSCPDRPGGGGCLSDGDPDEPACQYCRRDLALPQAVDGRIEYDPVDLWAALARVQHRAIGKIPAVLGKDGGQLFAAMLDAFEVVRRGKVLDDPIAPKVAEGLYELGETWRADGHPEHAEEAGTLARILLGEPHP